MADIPKINVNFRFTAFYEIKVGGNDWEFGGMVGDADVFSKIEHLGAEYTQTSFLNQLEESIARKDKIILAQREELEHLRALYNE